MHLQFREVLPFSAIQRQRFIKFRVLRVQDFYTAGTELPKRATPPSTGGVYKSVSHLGFSQITPPPFFFCPSNPYPFPPLHGNGLERMTVERSAGASLGGGGRQGGGGFAISEERKPGFLQPRHAFGEGGQRVRVNLASQVAWRNMENGSEAGNGKESGKMAQR